ncbi:hypothetical protein HQ393_08395 [Chitinibacter bivalviorum]|uniref:Uncharacterized protein n=1 Tax=Chitinibacter bivalviorum TaxID=2739434 RepID=A0A7H9BLG9_9NEIS|nr:hypothetical protein [Chitinibacter bivalviorum]QLG88264.1 hypothetical protein HQ393_08395 [Chitinibacter bivalviorum]
MSSSQTELTNQLSREIMSNIILRKPEQDGFIKARNACSQWANNHQAEIGVVEMAFGAGLIAWGVHNGFIDIGRDIVGSKLADLGGSISAGIGAIAGPLIANTILKSVFIGGVTCIQGVTLVPAIPIIALAGGSAAILGMFGYTTSGLASKFLETDFADFVKDASIVAVGLALLVDGARRVIGDDRVQTVVSEIKNGVLKLSQNAGEIGVSSMDDFQKIIKELRQSPSGSVSAGAGMAAGAAVGGSLATGSVAVLGSHGLGALALSLGIVSAPVWPIVAGGAAGLAAGVAAWKGIKHLKSTRNDDYPPLLLGAPNEDDK